MSDRRQPGRWPTTAVKIVCPSRHTLATLHPLAGDGYAVLLHRRAARYRVGAAVYRGVITEGDAERQDWQGWVKVPESRERLTLNEFEAKEWALRGSWACRCGPSQLDVNAVIEAAWAWSGDRRKAPAKPPAPRVIVTRRQD